MAITNASAIIGLPIFPTLVKESLFNESRLKVYRAERHIHEISEVWQIVFKEHLDKIGMKRNTQDGSHQLHANFPIPVDIGLAIGDTLRCLRSSLDYLVSSMARSKNLSDKHTLFPFNQERKNIEAMFDGVKELAGGRTQKAGSMHSLLIHYPDLKDIILDKIKPYPIEEGADAFGDLLWKIITMDNIDKHRLITPAVQSGHIANAFVGGNFVHNVTLIGFTKPAIRLAGKGETYCDMTFDIVFNQDTRLFGKPVISTLVEGCNLSRNVIDIFESSFRPA